MRRQNPDGIAKGSSRKWGPRGWAAPAGILLLAGPLAAIAGAQQGKPIGRTSSTEVKVAGAVEVHNGEMLLGNGSAVTAADQTVNVSLTRGGQLRLCATTSVHLSHDKSIDAPDSTALMIALDRGAIEANYETGKYSDVLLTPDLRILISGPGHADLKVRVNAQGDTCIDNHGANAPYVTVTSQMDGGLYRIQPNQHVTLEHGGLQSVVDTETEPCGCPAPPVSVADAGTPSAMPATPGKLVGGPSSTSADTAFPLAESEGLAPAPSLPTVPVAPSGEVHAQVTVPLFYNGEAKPAAPAAAAPGTVATVVPAVVPPAVPAAVPTPPAASATPTAIAEAPAPTAKPPQPGLFHRLGHFFSRIFNDN